MHIDHRQFNSLPAHKSRFPLAEGVGIFIGVLAWDLLRDGYIDITRALIIAAPCSLAWFGLRCWRDRRRDK